MTSLLVCFPLFRNAHRLPSNGRKALGERLALPSAAPGAPPPWQPGVPAVLLCAAAQPGTPTTEGGEKKKEKEEGYFPIVFSFLGPKNAKKKEGGEGAGEGQRQDEEKEEQHEQKRRKTKKDAASFPQCLPCLRCLITYLAGICKHCNGAVAVLQAADQRVTIRFRRPCAPLPA